MNNLKGRPSINIFLTHSSISLTARGLSISTIVSLF